MSARHEAHRWFQTMPPDVPDSYEGRSPQPSNHHPPSPNQLPRRASRTTRRASIPWRSGDEQPKGTMRISDHDCERSYLDPRSTGAA